MKRRSTRLDKKGEVEKRDAVTKTAPPVDFSKYDDTHVVTFRLLREYVKQYVTNKQ